MLKISRDNKVALYLGLQTSVLVFFILNFLIPNLHLPDGISLLPFLGFIFLNYLSSFLFLKYKKVLSFSRFLIIGTANTIVDFFVFNIFLFYFSENIFIPAKIISFVIALLHSLYWNSTWTFENKNPITMRLTSKFIAVTIIGLIINTLVSYSLTGTLTTINSLGFQINANLAVLIATILSLAWNFIAYQKLVFNSK